MEVLQCKCGCNAFDAQAGITLPWWEHIITCRNCGAEYHLPNLYVNGLLFNGYGLNNRRREL